MRKNLSALLICALLLSLLSGMALADDAAIQTGGTFIVGVPGEPPTYNPNTAMDEAGLMVMTTLFNNLVTTDADNNTIPDLAYDWAYNEDYTELTFHLREGVVWHDGAPFTSADAKWTYDTIIAENGTLAANLSKVTEITTPDDYTVVFHTAEPDSALLTSLGWSFGASVMPKHLYEGTDWLTNPVNQAPIGTSAYKFVSADSVSVVLEANEAYFGDGPYLDRIIFQIVTDPLTEYQMWQNGEIDLMYNTIPSTDFNKYDDDPAYNVRFNMVINRNYFTFNMLKEDNPTADLRVRQAFNLALDRQQILDLALNSSGAVSEYYISPLFSWALNEDAKIPARDVEQAKALLAEAGYTPDANGIALTVACDYFMFDEILTVAQANLREAGIDLQLNKSELNAWMERVMGGSYDVAFLGGDQGPDISSIGQRVGSTGGLNLAFYANPELDALLAQGTASPDPAERAPYYQQVQAIMAEDLPMVLTNEVGYKTITAKHIHGVPMVDDDARSRVTRYSYALVWIEQ
ncbi:MAG: ABC transporter substrate-binding protein [Oscillospiraceae bacterium]|jgi:peptide/nickel transport system substrate-binding protein|nr:ABC transporter substrate-binding protein [Oscillospiraceae bacterium]